MLNKIIKLLSLITILSFNAEASEIREYYKLKNGMEVLLMHDDRIPMVTHTIWYRVGSIDDPVYKSGVAHFLEHMMFKRFGPYPKGEYINSIEKNGGMYNAFTGPYYTAYFATLPSNKLPLIMSLESKRMTELKLEEADKLEFDREKSVVLDERRRRIDSIPISKLLEQMNYYNYRNNRFSIPIIGWQSEIKNINIEDMKEFYDEYYAPNNSILVIAGNFDIKATKGLIEQHYGTITKKVNKNSRQYFPVDPVATKAELYLSDPKAVNTIFELYNYKPITQDNKLEEYMLGILGTIVANSTNSRLYKELVERENMAENVNASIYCSPYHPCQFLISAEAKDKVSLIDISKVVDSILLNIAKVGISEEELELAKIIQIHSSHKFLYSGIREKSMVYGLSLLEGYNIKEITDLEQNYRKYIDSITREQINIIARNIFNTNYVFGILEKETPDSSSQSQ